MIKFECNSGYVGTNAPTERPSGVGELPYFRRNGRRELVAGEVHYPERASVRPSPQLGWNRTIHRTGVGAEIAAKIRPTAKLRGQGAPRTGRVLVYLEQSCEPRPRSCLRCCISR